MLRIDRLPEWDEVAAMNKHLKRIWTKVQLDPSMVPTAVWRDPRWRYDEAQVLREEAELLDPREGRPHHPPGRARRGCRMSGSRPRESMDDRSPATRYWVPLGLAGAIAFGMTQSWSFTDWETVDWTVILVGGGLAYYVLSRNFDPPPMIFALVVVPPALFAAGALLLHLHGDSWWDVDAVAVACYLGLSLFNLQRAVRPPESAIVSKADAKRVEAKAKEAASEAEFDADTKAKQSAAQVAVFAAADDGASEEAVASTSPAIGDGEDVNELLVMQPPHMPHYDPSKPADLAKLISSGLIWLAVIPVEYKMMAVKALAAGSVRVPANIPPDALAAVNALRNRQGEAPFDGEQQAPEQQAPEPAAPAPATSSWVCPIHGAKNVKVPDVPQGARVRDLCRVPRVREAAAGCAAMRPIIEIPGQLTPVL
jgi:hypothetical protein